MLDIYTGYSDIAFRRMWDMSQWVYYVIDVCTSLSVCTKYMLYVLLEGQRGWHECKEAISVLMTCFVAAGREEAIDCEAV